MFQVIALFLSYINWCTVCCLLRLVAVNGPCWRAVEAAPRVHAVIKGIERRHVLIHVRAAVVALVRHALVVGFVAIVVVLLCQAVHLIDLSDLVCQQANESVFQALVELIHFAEVVCEGLQEREERWGEGDFGVSPDAYVMY